MSNAKMSKSSPITTEYRYGFKEPERYVYKSPKGLSSKVVEEISYQKEEPDWMRNFRLRALEIFLKKLIPTWGADLSEIDFNEMYYYIRPTDRKARTWDDLPPEIKRTFDRLKIPEYEQEFLAGVGGMYDSENIYHSIREDVKKLGVIFSDVETATKEYPELVKQYFGTVIPPADNKFAALNSAVWSGGSFIYVPPGVHVALPLQAYFRINAENMGQFERTLIIADEGSSVHYVEGCTSPIYLGGSLHSAVVEIIVKKGARVQYTTIQNWSKNVYNLVTKRMRVEEEGEGKWIDFNMGSRVTMKYPSCYLMGRGAKGNILSMAFAGGGQHQDAGGKLIHAAPYTTSTLISKSISQGGGRTSYRGLLEIYPGAVKSKSNVRCDALILDPESRSDTYPSMKIHEDDVDIGHEATVSKIGEEQMFYLQSRGLKPNDAQMMIVNGFIEPFVKELPMEYAVEMNRMIEFEMEGSVG